MKHLDEPDTTEPVTAEASPPPTCRHCGKTRAAHEGDSGDRMSSMIDLSCSLQFPTFEPGPTYNELRGRLETLRAHWVQPGFCNHCRCGWALGEPERHANICPCRPTTN